MKKDLGQILAGERKARGPWPSCVCNKLQPIFCSAHPPHYQGCLCVVSVGRGFNTHAEIFVSSIFLTGPATKDRRKYRNAV